MQKNTKSCPYHSESQTENQTVCGHTRPTKTGVLLVNLGTPEEPTPKSVRKYLTQFLKDQRVIDYSPFIWYPILYGPVLTFRPKKVAKAYASIWNWKDNESPLLTITKQQTTGVQKILGESYVVEYAMRYGKPSVADGLNALRKNGANKLVILPLYPQYAGATSGTVADEVARWLLNQTWVPPVEILGPYHDHPAYIQALKTSTETQLKKLKFKPDTLIASFHGLPVRYCKSGDTYYCHCHKSARLLAEALGWDFIADHTQEQDLKKRIKHTKTPTILMTFQSQFGPEKWLGPKTDETIELMAEHNLSTAVTMPGFAADCLETLEEIAMEGKEEYIEAGGQPDAYHTLSCLNDERGHIALLASLCGSKSD